MTTLRLLQSVMLAGVMTFTFAAAEPLTIAVSVFDAQGSPVPGMVVVAESLHRMADPHLTKSVTPPTAVMDQLNLRFVPWVLPVRTGTAVVFPNSDTIAHQVYSFSPTKRFSLGLYRGQQHSPILFDQPGIAVLGCNIHDNMVGYIYVTDAQLFGTTDAAGVWRAAIESGEYRLTIWSPLLNKGERKIEQPLIVADQPVTASIHLDLPLQAGPTAKPHDRKLRDY